MRLSPGCYPVTAAVGSDLIAPSARVIPGSALLPRDEGSSPDAPGMTPGAAAIRLPSNGARRGT